MCFLAPRVLKLSYEDNPQLFGMPEDKLPPKRRSTVLEESDLKGERRVGCFIEPRIHLFRSNAELVENMVIIS